MAVLRSAEFQDLKHWLKNLCNQVQDCETDTVMDRSLATPRGCTYEETKNMTLSQNAIGCYEGTRHLKVGLYLVCWHNFENDRCPQNS